MNMNDSMPLKPQQLRVKINRGMKKCVIADNADEVFDHIRRGFFRHTDHRSVIQYAQEQIAAETVQERADAFISVMLDSIPAAFELYCYRLSDRENGPKCLAIQSSVLPSCYLAKFISRIILRFLTSASLYSI